MSPHPGGYAPECLPLGEDPPAQLPCRLCSHRGDSGRQSEKYRIRLDFQKS